MTDTTTATTRLSATLEPAPASVARWTITKLRVFRTLDGEGFEATVALDGTRVGTFANEGTGGGTWFRQDTRDARVAMDALLREWAEANPAAVSFPTITVAEDGSKSEPERLVSEEHVCDSLVENHRLAKKLDGIVKRGKTPVLTREQAAQADDGGEYGVMFGIDGYGTINGPADHPQVAALVARDNLLVWTAGTWK